MKHCRTPFGGIRKGGIVDKELKACQDMKYRLKACPFCGSDKSAWINTIEDWLLEDKYCVICDADRGGCGSSSGWYYSEESAVKAWNERKGPQAEKEPQDGYMINADELIKAMGERPEIGMGVGDDEDEFDCGAAYQYGRDMRIIKKMREDAVKKKEEEKGEKA